MCIIVLKHDEITDNVENKFPKSSEMLSTIFTLSPDAIVLIRVSDGKFIDFNL